MGVNKTVTEAAQVLEYLYEDDFKPKSVDRISSELDIPDSTVYRILRSWKQAGWAIEVPKPHGKGVLWQVSNKLASIAFAYERHMLGKLHSIKNEYQSTAGKELHA